MLSRCAASGGGRPVRRAARRRHGVERAARGNVGFACSSASLAKLRAARVFLDGLHPLSFTHQRKQLITQLRNAFERCGFFLQQLDGWCIAGLFQFGDRSDIALVRFLRDLELLPQRPTGGLASLVDHVTTVRASAAIHKKKEKAFSRSPTRLVGRAARPRRGTPSRHDCEQLDGESPLRQSHPARRTSDR